MNANYMSISSQQSNQQTSAFNIPAQTPRVPQVQQHLEIANKEFGALVDKFELLAQRLTPVLSICGNECGRSGGDPEPTAPLAANIGQLSNAIAQLGERVSTILMRLEV